MRAEILTIVVLLTASRAIAQDVPPEITTPNKVETRIGTLDFMGGVPSKETAEKVYDNLDRTHAFNAFVNTMQGVSVAAIQKGFLDLGVKDNQVLIFSELMDAKSLFLTANADTVYFRFIRLFGGMSIENADMLISTGVVFSGTTNQKRWAACPQRDCIWRWGGLAIGFWTHGVRSRTVGCGC